MAVTAKKLYFFFCFHVCCVCNFMAPLSIRSLSYQPPLQKKRREMYVLLPELRVWHRLSMVRIFCIILGTVVKWKRKVHKKFYRSIHLWVYPKNKNILLPNVQRTRAMAIFIKPTVKEEMAKKNKKQCWNLFVQIQHL